MAQSFRLDHTNFVAMLRERDWQDTSDIRQLADWLDARFEIPGTKIRFGFDSIIGLVPGIGDLITTLLGAYIIVRARELGAQPLLQARMIGNLVIDTLVGAFPILGKKRTDRVAMHQLPASLDARRQTAFNLTCDKMAALNCLKRAPLARTLL